MELKYRLWQEEIEESLLCLNWRREGLWKRVNILFMTLLCMGSLYGYVLDTKRFYLFSTAFLSLIFLFILLYLPEITRKRRAKQLGRQSGIYRVRLLQNSPECIMESEHVFTLKEKERVYCVPKRVLDEKNLEGLREYVNRHPGILLKIRTERRI